MIEFTNKYACPDVIGCKWVGGFAEAVDGTRSRLELQSLLRDQLLCPQCGKIMVKVTVPENPVGNGVPDHAKRNPVGYRYDLLNPEFEKWMAMVAHYGAEKYGAWNFIKSRLTGGDSPVNHIREHLRQYLAGEPYDHFDGDTRWHLVGIAFNAMMEFTYETIFDRFSHPLAPK